MRDTKQVQSTKRSNQAQRAVKASAEDIKEYQKSDPVYPLSHWVTIDGVRCAVERLSQGVKEDPKYEVLAPNGYKFSEDGLTSLICYDLNDVKERCSYMEIESK